MAHVIFVEQTKSGSKATPKQAATLKALGLKGRGTRVLRQDLRAIRGMLNHVQHMIRAERLESAEAETRMKPKKTNSGYKIQSK